MRNRLCKYMKKVSIFQNITLLIYRFAENPQFAQGGGRSSRRNLPCGFLSGVQSRKCHSGHNAVKQGNPAAFAGLRPAEKSFPTIFVSRSSSALSLKERARKTCGSKPAEASARAAPRRRSFVQTEVCNCFSSYFWLDPKVPKGQARRKDAGVATVAR